MKNFNGEPEEETDREDNLNAKDIHTQDLNSVKYFFPNLLFYFTRFPLSLSLSTL